MSTLYDRGAPSLTASASSVLAACCPGRQRLAAILLLGLTVLFPTFGDAGSMGQTAPNPFVADTSHAARQSAVRSIPIEKLGDDARRKVASVLAQTSVFRRMPIQVVPCDPEMYLFLVRNPDVVINIWRVLGVSDIELEKTGPNTYRLADGEGIQGVLQYIYSSYDTHIVYGECSYDGPLLKDPIRYRGLFVLKSGFVHEPDGRYYVTTRLDTFSCLTPVTAEFITQTFHPLVGRVADANFAQTAAFVSSLSRTAQLKPRSVQRLAQRLTAVAPEAREQLADLAIRMAERDVQARQERSVKPTALEIPETADAGK